MCIHRFNSTVNPKTKKRKRKRQTTGGKRRRRNRRRTRKKGRKRNTGKKRKHRRKKSKKSKRRGGVKMPSINRQSIKRKVISPRKKLSTPQALIDPLKKNPTTISEILKNIDLNNKKPSLTINAKHANKNWNLKNQ